MRIRPVRSVLIWLLAFGCSSTEDDAGGNCAAGQSDCGECVDVSSSALHCGSCGNACTQGNVCSAGTCRPASNGTGGSASASGGRSAGVGGSSNPSSGGTNSSGGSGAAPNATGGTSGVVTGGTNGAVTGGVSGVVSGGTNGAATGGSAPGVGGTGGGSAGATGGGTGGSPSGCDATGFHVRDGALYDVKCNEFVLRGVNYPYTWYTSRNTQQDLTAIAATGANAVRLVLSTGGRWPKTSASSLTSLITWAKAARLVSIVEVHDSTGYAEQAESVALTDATNYWTSSDIAAALKGQEAYVIINVANEPNGNDTSTNWAPSHVTAVQALRSAGLNHTLMVDAPNWGQDWQNTMRDGGGSTIWDADSQKNLVFSVHMYDVYGSSATVTSYFNTFLSKYTAPLVVGEFAADHGSSGDVDEATIMSLAENLSIGYLGWSWAGNGDGLSSLDITNNFDASSLTTWGSRLITGANGIDATSEPCSCFD